jgi:hypothetical protein
MRITSIIFVSGVLLGPALAAPSDPEKRLPRDDQPLGERYQDRWQGRQHILYDELWHVETDGRAPDANAECRGTSVRYRRPDGTTGVRRENTCN